ncbi:Catalase-related peroxidase [Pseudocercospora fuligena]|uniref:Catalase-related peroxidase n=1 Tax=Pseudocercospora fuligena TaxID=685502 RepID=A0A8H6VI88_9PEZI|nr:Catalase-related peroxidase [Pseudocercospora fuligena]
MPLPENQELNAVADDLVATIREAFGTPKHTRPVHARGQLTKGTFVPAPGAKYLSKAPIFEKPSTDLLARFSCDTGFSDIADTHKDANPRGLAIRFLLSEDGHTHFDLITNTAIGFAVNRGEGFLAMFKHALGKITEEQLHKDWPFVAWYQRNRKPLWPMSFASEQWHGIHAFSLDAHDGKRTFFRTRLVPPQGVMKMGEEETKEKKGTYLFDNLEERLQAKPPKPIVYNWMAQIADPAVDNLNDSSSEWPEDREFVHLGTFTFDRLWTMDEGEVPGRDQQRIIFDPKPRYMEGIGISDDPIIEMRTSVYLKSGLIRREANGVAGRDTPGHCVGR